MNKLETILKSISTEQHREAVLEIREWDKTGVLRDGVVRDLAHKVENALNIENHTCLTIVQDFVLRSAAFIWAGVKE